MSDRIAVMNGGRVEQVGTPREIYERPATPFVADFIGSLNALELRVDELVGGFAVMRSASSERVVVPAARDVSAGETLRVAVRPERVASARPASGDRTAARALDGHDRRGRLPRHVHAVPRRHAAPAASSATASPTRRSGARAGRARRRSPGRPSTPSALDVLAVATSSRRSADPSADLGGDDDDQRDVITTTATAITCGSWLGKRSARVEVDRERRARPDHERRDRVLVERGRERDQERGDDGGQDQRKRDRAGTCAAGSRRGRARPPRARRRSAAAAGTSTRIVYGQADHDVPDHDGQDRARDPERVEEEQQRDPEDDVGDHERAEQQRRDGGLAPEAAPRERDRRERCRARPRRGSTAPRRSRSSPARRAARRRAGTRGTSAA